MTGWIRTALSTLILLSCSRAQTIEGLLAEADAFAAAKKPEEAVKSLGRAAALAHKANDALAEQTVAGKLSPLLSGASDRAQFLAAILGVLDHKRAGAFVSARAIAAEILFTATTTGEMARVAEAARVLKTASGEPKSGKAVRILSDYAAALDSRAGRAPGGAVAPLQEVLKTAAEEKWADVALHAGTELAAQALAAGRKDVAARAIATVASSLTEAADRDLLQSWRFAVDHRLKDAPPEVLAAFEEATKDLGLVRSGAKGGPSGKGGTSAKSKLGHAWDRLSAADTLATVKRVDDGFEIAYAFDPELKAKQPLKPGFSRRAEEGLALGFRGRGVALTKIDLAGTAGGAGETSFVPTGTALYLLAKGETWSVSKGGAVSISGS